MENQAEQEMQYYHLKLTLKGIVAAESLAQVEGYVRTLNDGISDSGLYVRKAKIERVVLDEDNPVQEKAKDGADY